MLKHFFVLLYSPKNQIWWFKVQVVCSWNTRHWVVYTPPVAALRPCARFASASTSWQAGVVPVKDNDHNEGIIEWGSRSGGTLRGYGGVCTPIVYCDVLYSNVFFLVFWCRKIGGKNYVTPNKVWKWCALAHSPARCSLATMKLVDCRNCSRLREDIPRSEGAKDGCRATQGKKHWSEIRNNP